MKFALIEKKKAFSAVYHSQLGKKILITSYFREKHPPFNGKIDLVCVEVHISLQTKCWSDTKHQEGLRSE